MYTMEHKTETPKYDYTVVSMDVTVLKKGDTWLYVENVRHSQDYLPARRLIKCRRGFTSGIEVGNQYTLSLSVCMGEDIRTNEQCINYWLRESKPLSFRMKTPKKEWEKFVVVTGKNES